LTSAFESHASCVPNFIFFRAAPLEELLVFPVLAAGCANLEPRDGWGAGFPVGA